MSVVEKMVKLDQVSPRALIGILIAAIIVSLLAGNIIFTIILASILVYVLERTGQIKKGLNKLSEK